MFDGLLRGQRQAGENAQRMAQRNAVGEKRLEHAGHGCQRQRLRSDRFDQLAMASAQVVDQVADLVGAEQVVRPGRQQLVDVGGDDAFGIDREIAFGNREVARAGIDPQRRAAEAGIDRRFAGDRL